MPKGTETTPFGNIGSEAYVWGQQNGVFGRWPVSLIQGRDGLNGQDGANGADGVDGVDGVDGTNGIDGANGSPGAVVAFYLQQNFGGF